MKPIIFSTEMVQVILEGNKTQTRRVVKIPSWTQDKLDDMRLGRNGELLAVSRKTKGWEPIKQPYAVGDVLWVRETWHRTNPNSKTGIYYYKADGNSVTEANPTGEDKSLRIWRLTTAKLKL